LTKYFDLLIQGLHKTCDQPIDIAKWYNFTTFDISSDLTFGESFECLSTGKMHVSVRTFDIAKVCSVLTVVAVDLDNLWFHQIYGIYRSSREILSARQDVMVADAREQESIGRLLSTFEE
jgi:hypothetical protein